MHCLRAGHGPGIITPKVKCEGNSRLMAKLLSSDSVFRQSRTPYTWVDLCWDSIYFTST
ncbi:hypothetical protein BDR07DRAFT_1427802 [Suillus spraguei]|nr:hypothetical protein BDR07DRAFT_1427802 [Suillus spraguei]